MTTVIITHEVEDAKKWKKAWHKGPGSRHEMFAEFGFKVRNFQAADNPNLTGVLVEVPDMAKFESLLESDEGKRAMAEDGLKVQTLRILTEITP